LSANDNGSAMEFWFRETDKLIFQMKPVKLEIDIQNSKIREEWKEFLIANKVPTEDEEFTKKYISNFNWGR